MGNSFRERWPGLQRPAQVRDLPWAQGARWKLFNGAEGDAIGFAQGSIHCAGFGHPHLGVVEDQGRDVTGMGVAISHEAAALGRFIDRSLEDPKALLWSTQGQYWLHLNTRAIISFG